MCFFKGKRNNKKLFEKASVEKVIKKITFLQSVGVTNIKRIEEYYLGRVDSKSIQFIKQNFNSESFGGKIQITEGDWITFTLCSIKDNNYFFFLTTVIEDFYEKKNGYYKFGDDYDLINNLLASNFKRMKIFEDGFAYWRFKDAPEYNGEYLPTGTVYISNSNLTDKS